MVSDSTQYAIETFSLTKIFPDWWGRAKVIAVEDLNLKIKENEVYGLLGPNGSGKTTTLKMLLSLLHPSKGKSFILGGSSRDTRISTRVGYLPEESYLYKYLSAKETLNFYGRIFGIPRAVRKARIDSLLEMVGLAGMANRPIGTYSKGMARRIGLAQALINDPDVLILDEPTSGMDPLGTRQMKDLIMELGKRGKTVLLCSHLLADVEDVCDRIGIMYGGRMQVEGEVSSLLKKTNTQQITTGIISQPALDKIKAIIEAEKQQCQVSEPLDKLEEFFIRTVAAAQKQDQPTSGAMSKTKIDGFLAEKKRKSDLLDELVQSEDKTTAPEKVEKEVEVQPVHDVSADTPNVLDQLTQVPKPVVTKATTPDKTTRPKPVGEEEVKHDVLKDLVGGDNGTTEATTGSDSAGDDNA